MLKLSSLELLAPEGVLIAESATRNILPDLVGNFVKVDRRIYGDTSLELYVLGEQ